MKRVSFCKNMGQFMIIPTFGVTWRPLYCKFTIAFAWLNFEIAFRFGLYEEE